MMPIVDYEYSRECLTIEVQRSITAEDVVRSLAALFECRGKPSFIRSDNGPKFIAKAVKRWLSLFGIETLYIEPGSPWENPYSETFIGRLGDELLKREAFSRVLEAKVLVEGYRNHYNHERPHSERSGQPDTGGVWGVVRAERRRRRPLQGVSIDNCTLIVAGTKNGGRSSPLGRVGAHSATTSSVQRSRTERNSYF